VRVYPNITSLKRVYGPPAPVAEFSAIDPQENTMHVVTMIPANYPTHAPRGARGAATLFAGLWKTVARQFTPAAAAPLTRTEEAAEVRSLAQSVYSTDPRFAQDLFAAADRHELAGD
jgi:hypothetical protein